jgi:hypothetical protein
MFSRFGHRARFPAGQRIGTLLSGAWRQGLSMQRTSHLIQRPSLLAHCLALAAVAAVFLAPGTAGAQSSTTAARIKECRQRFAGKGKKKRQAERQCIKKARAMQRPKPVAPTEAPGGATPVSVTPDAPGGSPASAPGSGDTKVPSGPSAPDGPSAPTAPSVPEVPTPLELIGLATTVRTGSTVHLPPPEMLTSLSEIELTSYAEPGLVFAFEGGDLVISASATAQEGRFRLTFNGVGCTSSECDRRFVMHVRLSVEATGIFPTFEVTPDGPTSGPAGFGPIVDTPSCSEMTVSFDGWSSGFRRVANARETFPLYTPWTLPVGSHQVSFSCAGGEAWRSPGIEITVTGSSIPIGLESRTIPAGGELIFTSGGSLGAAPCPLLPGVDVSGLTLELNTSEGSILVTRNISMPDGQVNEGLLVPLSAAPGDYSASERCHYSNLAGEGANYEFAADNKNVIVTNG